MDRRHLLQMIAALTGCALNADDTLWAAADPQLPPAYSDAEIGLLDEVAETIIPRTDTPGAKDAAVGPFIARYSTACHPPEHIELLRSGIADIEARMQRLLGVGFRQAGEQARIALLVSLDQEARERARLAQAGSGGGQPHYFTLMKQLTLLGFFTSEAGATRVLRNRPIPGRYRGCIPYVKGQTFWAS
jgi:hypothetical protein